MLNRKLGERIWPETVVFWGSGAVASLGLPTTAQLSQKISILAGIGENKCLPRLEKVKKAFDLGLFADQEMAGNIYDLFVILDEEEKQLSISESELWCVLQKHFPGLNPESRASLARQWRREYDWDALRQIMSITPQKNENTIELIDLFNIIDLHRQSGRGIYVSGNTFISPERLLPARTALLMVIHLLTYVAYCRALRDKQDTLLIYQAFTDVLARLMQKEGLSFYQTGFGLQERGFYLFSYAIISMNWDPLLMWWIFNAHKRLNERADIPHVGCPPAPLKLFNDLAHFMGVRKVDASGAGLWYPFNESVVQRINDPDYSTGRRVRVGKIYFPHGCLNWRECPNCGKLNMYLGDSWDNRSPSLLSPPLLPAISEGWFRPRCTEERKLREQGCGDVWACVYCGTVTHLHHTQMVMQTSFKNNVPPYLEEIQRDMRVTLENARHLVFMGYMLPDDDLYMRSLLAALQARRNDKTVFCSIVLGKDEGAPETWLYGEQIESYFNSVSAGKDNSAIRLYNMLRQIFKQRLQARAYLRGIPDVFIQGKQGVDEATIRDILYPKCWEF